MVLIGCTFQGMLIRVLWWFNAILFLNLSLWIIFRIFICPPPPFKKSTQIERVQPLVRFILQHALASKRCFLCVPRNSCHYLKKILFPFIHIPCILTCFLFCLNINQHSHTFQIYFYVLSLFIYLDFLLLLHASKNQDQSLLKSFLIFKNK